MRDECMQRLVVIKDEKEADRIRGEIRTYDNLLTLPGIITDYLKNVSNGTFRKITESTTKEI